MRKRLLNKCLIFVYVIFISNSNYKIIQISLNTMYPKAEFVKLATFLKYEQIGKNYVIKSCRCHNSFYKKKSDNF